MPIALVMKKNPPENIMHGAVKFSGAVIVIILLILVQTNFGYSRQAFLLSSILA